MLKLNIQSLPPLQDKAYEAALEAAEVVARVLGLANAEDFFETAARDLNK